MMFGGLIAGMTTEGGGAVAFPVMTLALGIEPSVARDFSLMSQSCGKSIYIIVGVRVCMCVTKCFSFIPKTKASVALIEIEKSECFYV